MLKNLHLINIHSLLLLLPEYQSSELSYLLTQQSGYPLWLRLTHLSLYLSRQLSKTCLFRSLIKLYRYYQFVSAINYLMRHSQLQHLYHRLQSPTCLLHLLIMPLNYRPIKLRPQNFLRILQLIIHLMLIQ